ncbi:hypothetical protein [Dongia sp.]|uniref:hypothetical protein n=1 Tax=Dongia sp. TaxID=1977262 RepID=UPI0035B4F042
MAFFDRMTNKSFRRSDSGQVIYLPLLKLGPARLLRADTDEAAMRRIVRNFYRYAVLIVCPIIVLINFYLHLDGDFDLQDGFLVIAASTASLVPSILLVAYLGRGFDALDMRSVKLNALEVGDGPTLGAALALSAFTVWIGVLALLALYGSFSDYF